MTPANYARCVLTLYRLTPGTSGRVTASDRRLAAHLYATLVPLDLVRVALLLGAARRSFRPPDAPALARIASLHYFRPVVDELLDNPPDPGYVAYLSRKLASIAPDFVALVDHQMS